MEHNSAGVEYAKLSETKVGDKLVADGGFTCIKAGTVEVFEDDGGLFVPCKAGNHYLDGQCDDGDHIVGMVKS